MSYTGYIKVVLLMMLFYSSAITIYIHVVPSALANQLSDYGQIVGWETPEALATELQGTITKQTKIPIVDIGTLALYSGNIFIDFLLNFVTAIPQMISFMFNILFNLVHVPYQVGNVVQIMLTVATMLGFVLYLVDALLSFRAGTGMA